MAAQLTELGSVLTAHMDEEENTILPPAAGHLTVAEWEELGEISLAKLDRKHLLRAFSALMTVATPEEQRTLLATASCPPACCDACPAAARTPVGRPACTGCQPDDRTQGPRARHQTLGK
ncbi:hypothetical protein ACWIID_22135 [Streptomyces phaeochromogenes]